MVRDIKYIIKRIIIGVGIALILMALKGNLFLTAKAETFNSTTACIIGGTNNNVCSTPPVYDTFNTNYGVSGFNVWFYGLNVVPNETYTITFSAYFNSNNSVLNQSDMQLFTGTNGSASNRAYPDRDETFQFYQTATNEYRVIWSFQLDSLNTIDTFRFSFAMDNVIVYNGQIISLLQANLTISGSSSSGGGGGGSSSDSTNQDIINANNQNTQDIINNNNSNTDEIIDNQNQNTQDIIDNQNQNTQEIVESLKDCKILDDKVSYQTGTLYPSGVFSTSGNSRVSDYINIYGYQMITIKKASSGDNRACFYNSNKAFISCFVSSDITVNEPINIPEGAHYFRFTLRSNANEPNYKICKSGYDVVKDALTDDSGVDNSEISSLFGDIEQSNSPVSDLLTLPITLLQAYYNGIESNCSSYNLGRLYGTDIIFPCINLEQYLGSELWQLIDSLCCIYMIYNIAMLFVSVYESITSFRDSMDELYTPQHAKPLGKHTSEVV